MHPNRPITIGAFLTAAIVMVVAVVWAPAPGLAGQDEAIAIGVLAKRGEQACLAEWRPTADYLGSRLPGHSFVIVPLTYNKIYAAVKNGAVDFILANPSFYVELERWYGVNCIATLKTKSARGGCKTYGGVVFWSAVRTDITAAADFKGKRFMAADEHSLGGWYIIWRELKQRGIDPYRDLADLSFGGTHDSVVNAVASGRVDIGSVRTGILENMQAEGKIDMGAIRVLPPRQDQPNGLPFLCSTPAYPEWPLAKLRRTPDDLAEQVTVALLQLPAEAPAAVAADCAGWTIPLNYQPVHDCLRDLKVGPYQDLGKISWQDVMRAYWHWLLIALLAFGGSALFSAKILRLNQALRESHRQLEAEIAGHHETDEQLKQAKEEAEAATRAKSEFLANMSHEIRTPMNGVIAAAELAMNLALPDKAERYLKIIHSSAYSLLGIINDILDFSKIEAGKLRMESRPFMLDEILDRVVDLFSNAAAEKGIELLIDIDPATPRALRGDPLRLQQILTNLVGNAVKFTEKGGFIRIGVEQGEPAADGARLRFQVTDTGVGIAPEDIERLFEPFTQADASDTRRYEGTGLGLSICRRLVEMMAGRIWVHSQPGSGSTFSFEVVVHCQPEEPARDFVVPAEMRTLQVLVVDDCQASRDIVCKMLATFGYQALAVCSAAEALATLQPPHGQPPPVDLVIIDWLMPQMDGIQTSRQIRQTVGPQLPIVMMTAFGKDAERREAEQAGINVFLTKPIYQSTLFNAILDAFGKTASAAPTQRHAPRPADTSIFKKRLHGFHVLVVEDNPTNQQIAIAILESAGISAEIAANGREAVAAVQAKIFDAVLMDIQMPVMNGYEATRLIRQDPAFNALPIVAMTAHAMRGDEEQCLRAGMDGYIAKPIGQERLFQLLWRLLKNRQPAREQILPESSTAMAPALPPPAALPERIEGLQIQEALRRLQIDPQVYRRILTGFCHTHADDATDLRQAMAAGDRERLRLIAHTLKGSAANIGADRLHAAALALESAVADQAKIAHPSADLIEAVQNELARVCGAIAAIGDGSASPDRAPATAIDQEQRGKLLADLVEALDRCDPGAIQGCLPPAKPAMAVETALRLQRLIDAYDYEEALKLLRPLIAEPLSDEKGSLP